MKLALQYIHVEVFNITNQLIIYDIGANNFPKLYGNVHIVQDDTRGKHFPKYLEGETRERVRLYCNRQIESIHNRITKILIWIQAYYNCWELALESSLVLIPRLRSRHLPMKRSSTATWKTQEEGTWRKPELEGLLVKGSFSPLLLLPPLPADLVWRQWKCIQCDYMEDSIEDSATISIR